MTVDNKIRLLKPDEIEVRIGSLNRSYAQFLLYKNARVDRKMLTDIYGKWKNRFERIGEQLYCIISVYDEDLKQWIEREDCGIESKQEDDNRFKAEASDAFKRASTKFGIGEELYLCKNLFIGGCTEEKEYNNKKKIVFKEEYEDLKYLNVKSIKFNEERTKFEELICESRRHIVTFTPANFFAKVEEKKHISTNTTTTTNKIGFSVDEILDCMSKLGYNMENRTSIAYYIRDFYTKKRWRVEAKDKVILIDDVSKLEKCIKNRINEYCKD